MWGMTSHEGSPFLRLQLTWQPHLLGINLLRPAVQKQKTINPFSGYHHSFFFQNASFENGHFIDNSKINKLKIGRELKETLNWYQGHG